MSPARRLGASALLALAALALGPAAAPARAWTHFYAGFPCNSNPMRLGGHRAMTPICSPFSGGTVSLQTGPYADRADAAWRSWWDLNNANYAIWVRRDTCSSEWTWGFSDGQNKAWADVDAFIWGRMQSDESCAINGTPYITEVDIEVSSSANVLSPPQCAHGGYTFSGTWVHELGHGYGYDHFDDWLSTMNSVAPDVTSCLPSRFARPSSDAQQGYGALYGMPAAHDYGSTPMVQTGSLAMGNWSRPSSLTTYPAGTSSASITVRFTRMNMRSSWPNTTLFFRVYLSTDANKSVDDMLVGEYSWNWGLFAGAIYPENRTVTFNPSLYLTAGGATKCFLVEVDTSLSVSEVREDDNVMDTQICVRRSAT